MILTYEKLWKKLKEKNISLDSLAEAVGVEKGKLELMQNGVPAPQALMEKIATYLHCSPTEILDRSFVEITVLFHDELPEEVHFAALRSMLTKLIMHSVVDARYHVSDRDVRSCKFTLDGVFYLEDLDFVRNFIRKTIHKVEEQIAEESVDSQFEITPAAKMLEAEEDEKKAAAVERAKALTDKLSRLGDGSGLPPKSEEPANPPQQEEKKEESTDKKAPEAEKGPTREDKIASLRKELDGLVGAKEFRRLCQEIIAISSQFETEEAKTVFLSQTYLFSIGKGEGLTTAVDLLGKVIRESGIVKTSENVRDLVLRYEGKPEAIASYLEEYFDKYLDFGSGLSRFLERQPVTEVKVVLLDISEWIDHIGNSYFRDFLRKVSTLQDKAIIIFRIPFVDKDVLLKVREALNDAVYVRTVGFPPLSAEDYRTLAKIELAKYGYKVDASAWKYLEKRLTDEKSDGTFYGIKTLKKVIYELLYKKAVANASLKKPSKRITEKDTRVLAEFSAEDSMSAEELLSTLVGMEDVKTQLNEILNQIEFSRSTKGMSTPTIHMRFVGNPGTGKTTVARILGKILKEKGILRVGNFFEYAGRDFCGRYIGETSPKTQMMCRDAYGSVLFIDEAYTLYKGENDNRDFGREALDTLISEMENHRDDLLVIMAGYPDDMDNLMNGNAGLRSRIPYTIHFKNFTREELYSIFESLVKKHFKYDDELLSVAKEYFMNLEDRVIQDKEFSNGRYVRNLFERTWAKAAMRRDLDNGVLRLSKEDFLLSVSDQEFKKEMKDGRKTKRIGFGSSMS